MSLPPTFVKEFHNENCVRKMEYCLLGKTNLQTSKISIGGATFASFYGYSIQPGNKQHSLDITTYFSCHLTIDVIRQTF